MSEEQLYQARVMCIDVDVIICMEVKKAKTKMQCIVVRLLGSIDESIFDNNNLTKYECKVLLLF